MSLTPKQKQVLDFIKSFIQEKAYAPSKQEIADHFGFKSRGTVSDYLKRLKALGYIGSGEGPRNIMALQKGNHLPLLGKVAAGTPLAHFTQDETIEVPSNFLKKGKRHYCLQVAGDSMIDEAIRDGDVIVVVDEDVAENGQIVIASIEGESTLKRFYKKRNKVELHPANRNYDTIVVKAPTAFKIEGILVGVLRRLGKH